MQILLPLFSLFFGITSLGIILSNDFFSHKKDEKESPLSGHDELVIACFALLRISRRKLDHYKRLFLTYVLHLFVRALRLFDKFTSFLYVKLRHAFMKNAVKNKSTVPFFWEYLKTYKQEIDKEKERAKSKKQNQ